MTFVRWALFDPTDSIRYHRRSTLTGMVSGLPLLNVNEQCDEPKCSKSRILMAESFARTRLSPSFDPRSTLIAGCDERMNETEQMIQEIDGFLRAVGESPLALPDTLRGAAEIDLLRAARAEYTKRLLQ